MMAVVNLDEDGRRWSEWLIFEFIMLVSSVEGVGDPSHNLDF